MNFKTTLSMLGVLAVLACIVLFIRIKEKETPAPTPPTVSTEAGTLLFDVTPADVVSLALHPAEGQDIALSKSGQKWQLTKPLNAPAESDAANSLAKQLLSLRSVGQVAPDQASGLNPPKYSVAITTKAGKTLKFAIGDRTALGDVMYVQVEGNAKADVVPATNYEKFATPVADLRDKSLIHVTADQVQEVVVQNDASPAIVLKKHDGKWQETAPKTFPADADIVSSYVQSVVGLNASSYPKSKASTAVTDLDQPKVAVSIATTQPATQPSAPPTTVLTTVRLGQYDNIRKENVYAEVSDRDEVVKVAAYNLDQLKKSPLDFRDRNVVAINPDLVERFKVSVNRKATTQPTSQPADIHEYAIERRKELPPVLGPALPEGLPIPATKPAAATTQPSDQPTVTPAAAPATIPAAVPATMPASVPSSSSDSAQPAAATTQPADVAAAAPAMVPASQAAVPTTPSADSPATSPVTPPAAATTQPTDVVAAPPTTSPATEPVVAATQSAESPATSPTTPPAVAATQPATAPVVVTPAPPAAPASKWFFVSGATGDAEEGQVTALLDAFKNLRAEKFVEPINYQGDEYTITFHTIPGKATEKAADYTFTFIKTSANKVIGYYKDATFEVDASLIEKLGGDFKTKKPAPAPPMQQPGGFPGGMGGMPMGQ